MTLTLTEAGSARGKRSTPRSRKEKIPSTTRKLTSIDANTGRLTQSSGSDISLYLLVLGAYNPFANSSRLRLHSCLPSKLRCCHSEQRDCGSFIGRFSRCAATKRRISLTQG